MRYCDIADTPAYNTDDMDTTLTKIREKLVAGVDKRLDADTPVGFLLSGGLDSSLVCAIAAKKLGKPIRTFAIGMSEDAIDLKYAKQVADYLHADHTEVIINKEIVLNALEEVIAMLGTWDITTIRASVGMYLVCKYIHEHTDIRVLLTGEISDELFGYKYTDFAPSAHEFQAESQKRIRELFMYDVLRADRSISVNSLEARVPFGDLDFVKYVMSIDPARKMNIYNKGKYLLRKAFEGDWLPESILWREKAAFSDAVGHSMVDDIKEYAESYYTDREFAEKSGKYAYCRPFTKESLLYREIFEKYYPGQAEMIVDYWMPNKGAMYTPLPARGAGFASHCCIMVCNGGCGCTPALYPPLCGNTHDGGILLCKNLFKSVPRCMPRPIGSRPPMSLRTSAFWLLPVWSRRWPLFWKVSPSICWARA